MAQLRRSRHAGPQYGGAHDGEGFLGHRHRKFRRNDRAVPVDHGGRLGLRCIAQGAEHLREAHVVPSRSKTHSLPPVLTQSTSVRRTRCFVFAS